MSRLEKKMADLYFKKPNGVIIKASANHDLDSLKSRFMQCDTNGDEIKKDKKPKKKASKKKESK